MTGVRATTIGCLVALMGAAACRPEPVAVIGISTSASFIRAAEMALEDAMTADPGLEVDTAIVPELYNQAKPALEASQLFVALPGMVAVVGHSNSAASLAASQVYNEHEVVQVAPTASATAYSDAGPFSFRLVPPDDRQGAFLAGSLVNVLPAGTRIAVLYVNDDYGRGLRASLVEALTALDAPVDIVLDLPHMEPLDSAGGPGSMKAHLLDAVAAADPDAIVWLGRPTTLRPLLPEIRGRLGDVPIYGGDAVASARQLMNGDGRWRDVRYVDFVDMSATPELRAFAARYQEKYGQPAGGPEALTYDAMGLLLSALRAGASTGPEIREYLLTLGRERAPYAGITGPLFFDDRGDVSRSYHLLTVERP